MEEFEVDTTQELELREVVKSPSKETKSKKKVTKTIVEDEEPLVSCLRKERIVVRHIPKETGLIKDPRHVLYGGMAEKAVRSFVVPRLSSGLYVNVLTDKEKEFLEDIMGLEYNALSIYKKENNFWDDSTEGSIARVRLTKQDNYFDLSNPEDYIRYKILLANKDFIAPSLQALEDFPKATYQFVIVAEDAETKTAKNKMTTVMRCYTEYGKIEDDADTLRAIIEAIDGRPLSTNSKLEFLQTKINDLIQSNSKTFLRVVQDPTLPTKVLIKKAIEEGIISKRGDYLYLRSDNQPLCESNEEPTLNMAAKYLNSPKRQELKFSIEAQLKK